MESLAPLLLLACPVGMGLMMWLMGKGMRGSDDAARSTDSLATLRQEKERIDSEIRRREQADADAEPAEPGVSPPVAGPR